MHKSMAQTRIEGSLQQHTRARREAASGVSSVMSARRGDTLAGTWKAAAAMVSGSTHTEVSATRKEQWLRKGKQIHTNACPRQSEHARRQMQTLRRTGGLRSRQLIQAHDTAAWQQRRAGSAATGACETVLPRLVYTQTRMQTAQEPQRELVVHHTATTSHKRKLSKDLTHGTLVSS